ncbi:1363_t:CDS:1, partial [Gigaspora rosea]
MPPHFGKAAPPMSITSTIQQANKHFINTLTAVQIPKFSLAPLALTAVNRNSLDLQDTLYKQTLGKIKEIKTTIWKS